ncbi:MAG: flagellar basal-body MS-ring/collar protein FliF [Alkalilacustris sp.]
MSVWTALTPRRQAIVAGATLAVFLAVLGLARIASQPGMALLYAGVDGMAAGEMMQALDARNIRYEVRGDAIYVPAPQRDETRMMLAAQGLPSGGGRGYELLDGLSGFGTTSQMFDAAYWRAKEGELARTIVSSPAIRAARVHIAHVSAQPFRREIAPTASVTITPAGGGLPPGQARALRFLVASAVPGMTADDVAIIDGVSGTVLQAEDAATGNGTDREADLRRAVERILEAHVGRGRAVVELSLETVTETESIRERRIDPDSRVPIMSESEERTSTSSDTHPPGVTVASNLPDGDANAEGGRSQSQSAETRERLNFDVSELSRELHRAPGAVRRLTVAALVDGVRLPDETGTLVWQPRGAEELNALRELIAAAIGYDADRGDVISLQSLPLELPAAEGTDAPSALWDGLDPMTLIQLAVLALVALALGLFVLRPILAARNAAPEALAAPDPGDLVEMPPELPVLPALGGMGAAEFGELPALAEFSADGDDSTEDPVQRLRRLIEERQDETLQILRNWMEEADEGRT